MTFTKTVWVSNWEKFIPKNLLTLSAIKYLILLYCRQKKNNRTGAKRAMNLEIIDAIHILGIQDNNVNFLNPITISISLDTVIQKLNKYKKYR